MRERKPGVWELRVGGGRDPVPGPDGKPRYRTVTRTFHGPESRAARALKDLIRQVEREQQPATGRDLAWLLRKYADRDCSWSPRYRAGCKGIIEGALIPALGHHPIAAVTVDHLEDHYSALRRQGLAPSTIRQRHAILSGAFRFAVRRKYLPTSPAALCEVPGVPERRVDAPDLAALRAIIDKAAETNPQLATLIFLACTTGARRGELAGLQHRHVGDGVLRVEQGVVSLPGRGVVVTGTKTHQSRDIALDDISTAAIQAHLRWQADRAHDAGVPMVDDPFLFSALADGSQPVRPDSITRAFQRIRVDLGLPWMRFHDTRVLVATTLLGDGVDLRTIASRLGHGGGGIVTLRAYARQIKASDQAAANRMGALLAAPRPGVEPGTPGLEVEAGRPDRGAPEG